MRTFQPTCGMVRASAGQDQHLPGGGSSVGAGDRHGGQPARPQRQHQDQDHGDHELRKGQHGGGRAGHRPVDPATRPERGPAAEGGGQQGGEQQCQSAQQQGVRKRGREEVGDLLSACRGTQVPGGQATHPVPEAFEDRPVEAEQPAPLLDVGGALAAFGGGRRGIARQQFDRAEDQREEHREQHGPFEDDEADPGEQPDGGAGRPGLLHEGRGPAGAAVSGVNGPATPVRAGPCRSRAAWAVRGRRTRRGRCRRPCPTGGSRSCRTQSSGVPSAARCARSRRRCRWPSRTPCRKPRPSSLALFRPLSETIVLLAKKTTESLVPQ